MNDRIEKFNRALEWIRNNTLNGKGITVTSKDRKIYPEVTGYYIPTLLQWGERDLAISYAWYLCKSQSESGAWFDPNGNAPYVFDSAQIIKGLIAIRGILPEVDLHIIKGCDWILNNVQINGRLVTPNQDEWGEDEEFCSDIVHIYCLSPIKDAGRIFGRQDYLDAVDKSLEYYKRERWSEIANFGLLSHFYAYVMEGLFDLGEEKIVRGCMENLNRYQTKKGGIYGLKDVPWTCSTGMFQLALVWYKLGELEKGDRIFNYACSLQNKSGGWFGSYPVAPVFNWLYRGRKKPYYFPDAEISWANKYFLDALAAKEKLVFEESAPLFHEEIDRKDGRYIFISEMIRNENGWKICDIGCGKGRYIRSLSEDMPNNEYYAVDISETVMKNLSCVKEKKVGSLTCIPFADDFFDLVYVCEAYEHAINLHGAFKELYRCIKKGGCMVILDKPIEKLGQLEIYEWEQWIDDSDIKKYTEEYGGKLEIVKSVPYEDKNDGLFRAWIITKI